MKWKDMGMALQLVTSKFYLLSYLSLTKLQKKKNCSMFNSLQTDCSLCGKHAVYNDASLELMAGECQESGVLVSLRKMTPPLCALASC